MTTATADLDKPQPVADRHALKLTRCDRCGAEAKAEFQMKILDTGQVLELLLCQHDADKNEAALLNEGWTLRESVPV